MTKSFGDIGESIAFKYLQINGYKVSDRNVRNYGGEIDLVAIKDRQLFLIEVKTRKSTQYGLPEEYVNKQKLERIRNAGLLYKQQTKRILPEIIRILVIGIIVQKDKVPRVKLTEVF